MNLQRTSMPYAGEPATDFRERLARQQAEAAERRAHALLELTSIANSPETRIRIWERLHAIALPRDASHRLLGVIAANTGLTVAQVHAEQQQRASAHQTVPAAATDIPDAPG